MQEFWMVYNPKGRAPTYEHASFHNAKTEAARLARIHPDQDFYVLRAVGLARKEDVRWHTPETHEQDIPF